MPTTTTTRRKLIALLLLGAPCLALIPMAGCGGDPDQRTSGTLVMPLESVERAGEESGKLEDAKKKPAR